MEKDRRGDTNAKGGKQMKRSGRERKESSDGVCGKRPKRAVTCTNLKEKSIRIYGKRVKVKAKKEPIAEDEIVALSLTSLPSSEPRQTRRLTDFFLHDTNGDQQPVEMLETSNIFITGVVLAVDECSDKGVRCESFGRVENWNISGYEDGYPVIWISTDLADYDCLSPAHKYKDIYEYFITKACASVEVYKKLSKSAGGNPDTCLEELLAAVSSSWSMREREWLPNDVAIRDFVVTQGVFIYNQLAGLDETAKKHDARFVEIPVLIALRDMSSYKLGEAVRMEGESSNGALRIGGVSQVASTSEQLGDGADMVRRYARIMKDEEYRITIQWSRKSSRSASASKFYINVNEDDIAYDYPSPSYYKNSGEAIDEFVLYKAGYRVVRTDDLPCKMLHNWVLYSYDTRLISLELLPMKFCADIGVTIYGSGLVTEDDGNWIDLDDSDDTYNESHDANGVPIFLSQIKEWKIEYGSSMVSISLRTDLAWYRLGKPSKQYGPWRAPVLKTARVAVSIMSMLDDTIRKSRLSFGEVIKKVSQFEMNDNAYISSDPSAVARYLLVHGEIVLQMFAEYPVKDIQKCAFVTDLASKMKERHNTKWAMMKKKKVSQKKLNLNPREGMEPVESQREAMQATTTRLINRIWGEYYSISSPEEDALQVVGAENGVEEESQNEKEDDEEVDAEEPVEVHKSHTPPKNIRGSRGNMEIRWEGEILGQTCAGEPLYRQALVGGEIVAVGGAVISEVDEPDETPVIYFVEYMFESSDHCKMLHGRLLQRGAETVLRSAGNERELFLTNECMTVQLKDIKATVCFEIRSRPWGHQYWKENNAADKLDRARAEERKAKGLPIKYYCRFLYSRERGGFFSLLIGEMGLGSGSCSSCRIREEEEERSQIRLNGSGTGFFSNGVDYSTMDFVYVNPQYISTIDELENGEREFEPGGLKAFVVGQIIEVDVPRESGEGSFEVIVSRFYRPEDISADKAYASDIQELYHSEDTYVLPPEALEGKCEVRKKNDMPLRREYPILDNIFFCELLYDSSNGSLKKLPVDIKPIFSTIKDDTLLRKQKGKGVESETDTEEPKEMRLATLDIFAGCGGLSKGLEQSGVSATKWAIEYEEPDAQAFKQNHPEATVIVNNCNVILRAIMEKCGDQDECISTTEANELAAKLDEEQKRILPLPGQVDFINGGPPCQGFSCLNRFRNRSWSIVQRQMILAFLSYADYFRPRYFLLENVRNFVSFNEGQTFKLTLASLLEMGYQVRFGILDAGAYGVSQTRKRAFIWAAAPEEVLPEWPEPMHVFGVPELRIKLPKGLHYAAVRSTQHGAPFRSITVKDTIGDLPPVENGESKTNQEYETNPVSWFQKEIRGNMNVLTDHICKKMNEINLFRCKNIPKSPGADWRYLPNVKVKLSNGQREHMIPTCILNKASTHNNWKGLYGRLDWQVTDPQPTSMVGMCFHPDQDRILTVREYARSQGFPDSYKFAGKIGHKHRQIGNAVPPPLAFALGRKLKEAVLPKKPLHQKP